jgi:hypothetical protein
VSTAVFCNINAFVVERSVISSNNCAEPTFDAFAKSASVLRGKNARVKPKTRKAELEITDRGGGVLGEELRGLEFNFDFLGIFALTPSDVSILPNLE